MRRQTQSIGGSQWNGSRSILVLSRFLLTCALIVLLRAPSAPGGTVGAPNDLYVTSGSAVEQFDGATGAFVGTLAAGGVTAAEGLVFLPTGDLLVVGGDDDLVNRYDGCAGTDLGVFADAGGLSSPRAVAQGPNGNVYVAGATTNAVIEYDGETGAFVQAYADAALSMPTGLAFDANGNLYVSSAGNDTVIRFAIGGGNTADIDGDGDSDDADVSLFVQVLLGEDTGDPQHVVRSDIDGDGSADGLDIAPFVDGFLNGGATGAASVFATGGGLTDPRGLVFDANGDLLVSSFATDEVLRFDGVSGAFVDAFATGGGLDGPVGIAFGPDGHLYVAGSNANKILRYDGATGGYIDDFVTGVASPRYLTFKPPFTIDEVSPNEFGLCIDPDYIVPHIALTMTGSGLTDCSGLAVMLTRAGEPTIYGEIDEATGTQSVAEFNVIPATVGPWTLEVWDGFGNTTVLTDAVTFRECSLRPRAAWGGAVKTVFIEDSNPDIVYIGSGRRLVILSVTDSGSGGVDVVELSSVTVGALVMDVAVKNGVAYVSTKGSPSLVVSVDVSDPTAPQIIRSGFLDTFLWNPKEVDLYHEFVIVRNSRSLFVLDATDPADPRLITRVAQGRAGDFEIIGDLLYMVTSSAGEREVQVYELTTTPSFTAELLASAPLPPNTEVGQAIAVDGEYVYASTKWSSLDPLGSVFAAYRFDQSDPENPTLDWVGTETDFRWATDIAASNNYVVVADWPSDGATPISWDRARGVVIFDANDPTNPQEIAQYKPHGGIRGVEVYGDRAYVMDEGEGLAILDISDPSIPTRVGVFYSPTYLRKLDKQGNLLYVSNYWHGVAILDVSDASAPELVGAYQTPLTGVAMGHLGIRAVGDRAYLGAGFGGIEIVDISDPTNPALLGARRIVSPEIRMLDLDVRGGIAYVGIHRLGDPILANFDITDPSNIQMVGSVTVAFGPVGVHVSPNKIAHVAPQVGYQAFDQTDPQQPTLLGTFAGDALDVAARGDYAYTADNDHIIGGLHVYDVSDRNAPFEAARLIVPSSTGISINGTRAYLLGRDPLNGSRESLFSIDISSPTSPVIVERISLGIQPERVLARDGYAYVTGEEEGLTIVEVLCESGGGAPGACCLESGECMEGVTASDCDCIFGGVFQGEGTTCNAASCTGACCTASGCVEGVTEAQCVFELDGIYRGNDSDCGVPCPTGACCSDTDGSCAVLTEAECLSTGDTYLGHDTVCETDPPSCPFGQYSNTIDPVTEAAVVGSGLRLADDLTLAGIGARELTYMDLRVFGNGGGPFDVTIALYTDCPGDGGTQIPGTVFSFSNIPDDGSVYTLVVDPVAPSVTIPDTVWMLALFSTPQAGWVVAGEAEVGSTENRYGRGTPWNCNNTFAGAHAGLWANLRCVEGGARSAAVGGSAINASQLRVIRVETEAPLELISPFELQNGNE